MYFYVLCISTSGRAFFDAFYHHSHRYTLRIAVLESLSAHKALAANDLRRPQRRTAGVRLLAAPYPEPPPDDPRQRAVAPPALDGCAPPPRMAQRVQMLLARGWHGLARVAFGAYYAVIGRASPRGATALIVYQELSEAAKIRGCYGTVKSRYFESPFRARKEGGMAGRAPSAPAFAPPAVMARTIALHSAVESALLHCTVERFCSPR